MQSDQKIIGVIPARFDSMRLPGKALLPINGKPMIRWVYDRARRSPLLSTLLVATDSEKIRDYCRASDIPVLFTRRHVSGSDRLHEVMERTDGDIYVNIQGDEPTVRAEHLQLLLEPLIEGTAEVATLKKAIDHSAAQNPNIVKVVTDTGGRALYFSRFPIPYARDSQDGVTHYKHIGLYGYTRAALALFHALPQSGLELAERLEQLRYLENGIPIIVAETSHDTIGVDTEDDLKQAAAFLSTEDRE